ncbi:MAG TPA: ATP-binding protein [Limnobacter sp.]|nr:ATP-binding protein [Limnobacter sp.]
MQNTTPPNKQLRQLRLLQQITRAVAEQSSLDDIYDAVARRLEHDMALDFCLLASYNAGNNMLTPRAVGPNTETLANLLHIGIGSQVSGYGVNLEKALAGITVHQPDLSVERGPIGAAMHTHGQLHSLIICPLKKTDSVLGILVLARRQKNSFSDDELEFIVQLGEHLALALSQTALLLELQEANARLKHTQALVLQQERLRALAGMAAGIAHDINNAISPASVYVDTVLMNEHGLSERGKKQLEMVQTAIDDVANTVTRMGQFARNRDEQPIHTDKVCDANTCCVQALEFTKPRWQAQALREGRLIDIKPDLMDDLPLVKLDASELRETITNLLFNAVDALPDGGSIVLRTSLAGVDYENHVLIEVQDNGTGMDALTLGKCMEPFVSSKGSRGSGLGLSMVYGCVQRAGGHTTIESTLGRGTCVQIYLPFEPNSLAPEQQAQLTAAKHTRVLNILVVDDEQRVLESTADVLISTGHRVVAITSAVKALSYFEDAIQKNNPFDLLITDLGMSEMDGQDLARRVKSMRPSTSIILLTGWGQQVKEDGLKDDAVDLVLAKPIKARELIHHVNIAASNA